MTRSQRVLAVAAVAIVIVVAAGWFALISPQRASASKLRSESATAEQKNAALQDEIYQRTIEEKGVVAQEARIAAIQQQIPATVSLASYVRLLTDAASKAGVDIRSVAPGQPIAVQLAKVTPAPSASAKQATGVSAAPKVPAPKAPPAQPTSALSAVPVQLEVDGGYFEIQQFLTKLQGLQRATDVTSVDLTPGGAMAPTTSTAAPTTPPWQVLKANISLDIFMTSTPLPAVPAGAPASLPSPSPSPSH